MGAINLKMEGISFAKNSHLKDFSCSQKWCGLRITQQDIENDNYSLWVSDYANEIVCDEGTYGANFWLKGVDHQECPASERCQGCYERFLTEKLKEHDDYYYCSPCYQQISPNIKDHER